MSAPAVKTMRDAFIGKALEAMGSRKDLYFLSADFGAPLLDRMRREHPCRFFNVGIAEQNLINVSAGLAFEGMTVHAYAISAFLATRAFEQIKINLSLHSRVREVNVNLVAVGAGLSYDISGPTHHGLEDISVVNSLPGIDIFSPSDWALAERFHDYALAHKRPKYLRLDGKPLPALYAARPEVGIEDCFCELERGEGVCLLTTGYMTHAGLEAVNLARGKGLNPGLVDIFLLRPLDAARLAKTLSRYRSVITVEEGFAGAGGLDAIVRRALGGAASPRLTSLGFRRGFVFERGDRRRLHTLNGLDPAALAALIERESRP